MCRNGRLTFAHRSFGSGSEFFSNCETYTKAFRSQLSQKSEIDVKIRQSEKDQVRRMKALENKTALPS